MTYMSSPDDRSGLSERAQMERLAAAKAEQRKRDAMRQGHHVEEDAMQPKLQDMIAECQRLCPSKRFALSDGINGGDVVWLAEIGNGTKDDLLAESTTPERAVAMLLELVKKR